MTFNIGNEKSGVEIGLNSKLFVMAGPCVIESEQACLNIAKKLIDIGDKTGVPVIFKASFDKANRSSIASYRGPGLEKGLDILSAVQSKCDIPVMTDVHEPGQAAQIAKVVDCLQVGTGTHVTCSPKAALFVSTFPQGNFSLIRVPSPNVESTSARPRKFADTRFRTMESPRPVPPFARPVV